MAILVLQDIYIYFIPPKWWAFYNTGTQNIQQRKTERDKNQMPVQKSKHRKNIKDIE